ncbi:DUF2812 domain-containing protein [Massilia sp. G4R7]|uniref:DUF2812 domain-containing protein n=1 Tax=Massilia phyllostachyos TaxID=2898585 RepID=A0ABS8QAH7_9BURK|nr:DUF2812 domain-containing protein [Massilia phyllostachyos]
MSGTIRKFKFFFAHQDEEQEAWLRSMARQGLHLADVDPFCRWTFRRGAPADIVYRVDFSQANEDASYRQLMQDAGWTLAATTVGWQYWATKAVDGRAPELFTDNASKARKFKQLLSVLVCTSLPLFIMIVTSNKQQLAQQLSTPSLIALGVILSAYFLIMPYSVLRLLVRVRELK